MAKLSLLLFSLVFSLCVFSQPLVGQKSVPGDYATFTAAVADLNSKGVGPGGVVFNITAGYVENITGEVLVTATGTAASPITFQKFGVGINPKLNRTDPGSVSPTVQYADGDAVLKIAGSDYITFSGIDLGAEQGTIEYGFFTTKVSATDGCKNLILQGANITMAKGNSGGQYTIGIYISNHLSVGAQINSATGVTVSAEGGRNENIQLLGNTVQSAFHGIHVRGYSHTISPHNLQDQNITIGSVSNGNVIQNFGNGPTSIASFGMLILNANNVNISHNTVSNLAGGGTAHNNSLYGISLTSGYNVSANISENTISLSTTGALYGIYSGTSSAAANSQNIFNNRITNCASSNSGTYYLIYQLASVSSSNIYGNLITSNVSTGSAPMYVIYQGSSVTGESKIYNNNIADNSKSASGGAYYIYNSTSSTASAEIYGNTITGNNCAGSTAYGIYHGAGTTANIYRNKIADITNTSASGIVYGLSIAGGTTNNVFNNFIYDLKAPLTSSTSDAVRGINVTSTTSNTTHNLSFNTIFLNASSTGTNFNTSGVSHTTSTTSTSGTLNLRSNSIVNISTPAGTGYTVAYRRSTSSLSNYGSSSNNNNFYAGTPGPNNLIFFNGTAGTGADQQLTAYKQRVTPIDNGSISELPPFVNVSSAPYDIHLLANTTSQLESGGIAVAGINSDFDGDLRFGAAGYNGGGNTPDIGADEWEGRPSDITPPQIDYAPLKFTCLTGNRTLTATITDVGGIQVAGASRPRIYYRKQGSTTWQSSAGTLVSGNANVGTWEFVINAADIGGLAINDGVEYYVIAQDDVNNIASRPTGTVAVNVNNITTHTATPFSYNISNTLNGVYTINSNSPTGGTNFRTFQEAANVCISGPVVFNVQPGTYNEQLIIEPIAGASAVNTVTFNGNGQGLSWTSTNTNERAVIKLSGADYITFNNLIINATGSQSTEYGYGVQLVDDADNNTINNCTINITTTPATAASTSFAGIVVSSSAATTPTTNGDNKCDNNTFSGNVLIGGYYGMTMVADGANSLFTNGNKITGNVFQDYYSYGIYVNGTNNALIEGNEMRRPSRTSIGAFYGIYVTEKSTNLKVLRNKIHSSHDGNLTATTAAYGIYLTGCDGTSGNENIIANNMIYRFNNLGTQYGFYNSSSDFAKYYYNSVLLDNNTPTTSATYDTRGFYQTTAATGIELKNNIIQLLRKCIGENHCLYFNTSTTSFVSDYNNLRLDATSGAVNAVAYLNAVQYQTLASWKGTGRDLQSRDDDPKFVSATDLHLQPSSPLDDKGIPVPGIQTDIDGETRSLAKTEIGADELPLPTGIDMQVVGLISPVLAPNGCYTTETITVALRNNSQNPIDFASNPVTLNVTVGGVAPASFSNVINNGTLASGALLNVTMATPGSTIDMSAAGNYVFNAAATVAGDVNTNNNAMEEVSFTKAQLSAGDITINPLSYCLNGGRPTLSATGLTGYDALQWQQSNTSGSGYANISGATSNPFTVAANLASTTFYRLVVSCGVATANSAEKEVTLNTPQILATTPATICGPGTAEISATVAGGNSLNWYAAASGGNILHTGSTFTTPLLNTSTTYYAAASTGTTSSAVGPVSPAIGASGSSTIAITTQRMFFDVLAPSVKINSVDVFPTAAVGSTFTVVIRNASGTVIYTSGNLTTTVTGGNKQTVVLDAVIPQGTDYQIGLGVNPGMIRNTAGAVYPYTIPGVISLTGHSFVATGPDYYYFVYNINVTTGCESNRTPVVVTVKTQPDINTVLAGTNGGAQVCKTYDVISEYYFNNCALIAKVSGQGASPVSGEVNACVKIDPTVQTYNGQPYLQRHFDIVPTNNPATATGRITMYATQAEFNAYNTYVTANNLGYPLLPSSPSDPNIANVRVTQFSGTGTAPGNYNGGAKLLVPVSVTWNLEDNWWEITIDVVGFSGFYIHTTTGVNPLPANILTFSGVRQGGANVLKWTVAQESDVKDYVVLRSEDGRNWSVLGAVRSLGNTTQQRSYSFSDNSFIGVKQLYRLRQIDWSGAEKLSNIVTITGNRATVLTLAGLFPNPAVSRVNLLVDAPAKDNLTILVMDAVGRVVKTQRSFVDAGSNTLQVDVTGFAQGSYLIKVTCDSGCQTLSGKFVKE